MPIYKRDEIIAWYDEKTSETLCPECFEVLKDNKGYLLITDGDINEDQIVVCDECETILNM